MVHGDGVVLEAVFQFSRRQHPLGAEFWADRFVPPSGGHGEGMHLADCEADKRIDRMKERA